MPETQHGLTRNKISIQYLKHIENVESAIRFMRGLIKNHDIQTLTYNSYIIGLMKMLAREILLYSLNAIILFLSAWLISIYGVGMPEAYELNNSIFMIVIQRITELKFTKFLKKYTSYSPFQPTKSPQPQSPTLTPQHPQLF